MNPEELRHFLLASTLINYGILLVWFAAIAIGHDSIFRLHSRWFKMPAETFNAIHYASMAVYKIGIILFNLVPYIALVIMD